MLKEKERDFQPHVVSLESLVPEDNFYRQVEAKLDLTFVRDLVQHLYKPFGRPAIDPVVFFKLQLIMFFEGIRSERQLMELVNMRLDCRWYLGYDLDEEVPNHSSLSKIRDRFGLEIFQRFFEQIVELCMDAGLVWGKELYFDGTKVRANADINGLIPRWYWQAKQQLDVLFPDGDTPAPKTAHSPFIDKYDGTRLSGPRTNAYTRTIDQSISPVDPDASPMRRFTGDSAKLGYHTQYVVDGGQSRIILAALVTPASIMDNTPMLDLARWVRFRWRLHPHIAVGDTMFGTTANITGLEQDGIRAYTPITDLRRRTDFYTSEDFDYDAEANTYICPQGQQLPLYTRRKSEEVFIYRADAAICNRCPVKAFCTDSRSGRYVFRSFFQEYLDRVRGYWVTAAYQKAMRKRKVWIEPKFGELKQWHQGRRFRLRGLHKVNIEGLLKAAGQNIKQLLKAKRHHHMPNPPANAVAIRQFPAYLLASCVSEHRLQAIITDSVMCRHVFFNGLRHCAMSH